jgi:hypothetical protein
MHMTFFTATPTPIPIPSPIPNARPSNDDSQRDPTHSTRRGQTALCRTPAILSAAWTLSVGWFCMIDMLGDSAAMVSDQRGRDYVNG